MKKSLFILATAAIALASCNNDVKIAENKTLGNEPQEIGLFTMTQKVKKAPSLVTTYDHGDDFDVVAYLAAGGSAQGDYFPSTNFKYDYAGGSADQGSSYWAGTTPRYWPLTASTINFLAVSNKAGGVTGKVSTVFGVGDEDYVKKAVVTLSGNQAYQQTDLMYAAGQGRVTQTGNALSYNPVAMQFQHALALVGFQVKTATTNANVEIKVNSITLNGAHYNGTYTIINDGTQKGYDGTDFTNAYNSTTDLTATSSWTNMVGVWSGSSYTAATQMVPMADYSNNPAAQSAALNATPADFGGYLLVIPDGSAASEGVNVATGFTINYTITMGGNANTYDYTYTFADAEKMWKQRKKYTYIINITLHEIFVNATVAEWDDTTPDINVDVPQMTFNASTANSGTYTTSAAEGTYTVEITGLTSDTYTVSGATGIISAISTSSLTSVTSIKITFTVSGTAGSNNITITDSSSNVDFTLTVTTPAP